MMNRSTKIELVKSCELIERFFNICGLNHNNSAKYILIRNCNNWNQLRNNILIHHTFKK